MQHSTKNYSAHRDNFNVRKIQGCHKNADCGLRTTDAQNAESQNADTQNADSQNAESQNADSQNADTQNADSQKNDGKKKLKNNNQK